MGAFSPQTHNHGCFHGIPLENSAGRKDLEAGVTLSMERPVLPNLEYRASRFFQTNQPGGGWTRIPENIPEALLGVETRKITDLAYDRPTLTSPHHMGRGGTSRRCHGSSTISLTFFADSTDGKCSPTRSGGFGPPRARPTLALIQKYYGGLKKGYHGTRDCASRRQRPKRFGRHCLTPGKNASPFSTCLQR